MSRLISKISLVSLVPLLAACPPPKCELKFGTLSVAQLSASTPSALAIGDLDGDGFPEFWVVDTQGPDVQLSLFNSKAFPNALPHVLEVSGKFVRGGQPTITVGREATARGIAVGDVDGDGILDLVVAVTDPVAGPGLIIQPMKVDNTDGARGQFVALPGNPVSVVVEGHAVLALVASSTNGTIHRIVWSSENDHPDTARSVATGIGYEVRDFDGTSTRLACAGGTCVAVSGGAASAQLHLFKADLSGSITKTDLPGTNPSGLAIGDVDGDGILDVAVVQRGSATVTVLLSSINFGTFNETLNFSVEAKPAHIALVDLDGDGMDETFVTNDFTNAGGDTYSTITVIDALDASARGTPIGAQKTSFASKLGNFAKGVAKVGLGVVGSAVPGGNVLSNALSSSKTAPGSIELTRNEASCSK